MGKPELGAKHTCAACAERFYDLNRMPAVCPKCQAEQPPEKPRVVRPTRGMVETRRMQRVADPAIPADEDAPAAAVDSDEDDAEDVIDPDVDDDDDDDIDIPIDPEVGRASE